MGKIKMTFIVFFFMGCKNHAKPVAEHTVIIGNWKYRLTLQRNNSPTHNVDSIVYVKASLQIGNIKTQQSLLYSASRNQEEYKKNYNYLSFYAGKDLYIKDDNSNIYPLGYVFEPSNGLTPDERLVYKFAISKKQYLELIQENSDAAFWYHDRISKLGKICLR